MRKRASRCERSARFLPIAKSPVSPLEATHGMDLASLKRGELGERLGALAEVREKRAAKLREQNVVATELDRLLRSFRASSARVMKSVEVAITVSRQPGYIDYARHSAGDDLTELRSLVERVDAVGRELSELDAEIARRERENAQIAADGDVRGRPGTIAEWLERNGRPKALQRNMLSRFVPHERSRAVSMVKGRLIE